MARAAAAKENGARPGLPRSTDGAPTATRISSVGAKPQRASRVPGANSLEIVMPCWTHPRRPPIAPGYTALLLPHLDRLFAHRRALLLGELLEGVVGRGRILSIIGQPLCEHEQKKGGPGNTRQHSRCMRRRSHFEQENCGILEPGSLLTSAYSRPSWTPPPSPSSVRVSPNRARIRTIKVQDAQAGPAGVA